MLILRNKLTKEKWEVLDTDDNTIEVATEKDLAYYVEYLGLTIQGVVIPKGGKPVFTPQLEYSVKETKLNIRRGIKLHAENGVLKHFDYDKNSGNITINLSDYCTSIAPYCFKHNNLLISNTVIRLIFDNTIDFKPTSVANLFCFGEVIVDIRALDDKKASYIYKQAFESKVLGACVSSGYMSVVDNEERLRHYQAEALLNEGMPAVPRFRSICEETLIKTKVLAGAAEGYKPAFETLVNTPIRLNKSSQRNVAQSMHNIYITLSSSDMSSKFLALTRQYLALDKDLVLKLYHACFNFHLIGYLEYWHKLYENVKEFSENYTNSL